MKVIEHKEYCGAKKSRTPNFGSIFHTFNDYRALLLMPNRTRLFSRVSGLVPVNYLSLPLNFIILVLPVQLSDNQPHQKILLGHVRWGTKQDGCVFTQLPTANWKPSNLWVWRIYDNRYVFLSFNGQFEYHCQKIWLNFLTTFPLQLNARLPWTELHGTHTSLLPIALELFATTRVNRSSALKLRQLSTDSFRRRTIKYPAWRNYARTKKNLVRLVILNNINSEASHGPFPNISDAQWGMLFQLS